jgi:hypothetical protein
MLIKLIKKDYKVYLDFSLKYTKFDIEELIFFAFFTTNDIIQNFSISIPFGFSI